MASSLKTPEPFSFGASDLAAQWGVWRRQFEWYLVATRSGLNVDEEQLVGVLLTLLGAEGLKIYESFVFALAGDGRRIVPVLDRFTLHFEPRRSEVFERFKFLKRHQLPGENFDSWLIELRTLIKSCGYGVGADSVLRDQIVLGVADPLVREKLLFEKDLLLIKACDIVRACESSKAQLTQFGGAQALPDSAHALRDNHATRKWDKRPVQPASSRPPPAQHQSAGQRSSSDLPPAGQQYVQCTGCGRRHKKDQCRAANIRCHGCGILGHFVGRCPTAPRPPSFANPAPPLTPGARVHAVDGESPWIGDLERGGTAMINPNFVEENYYVTHQLHTGPGKSEWFQKLSVDGVDVDFKLDSGATCNILP